MLCGSGIFVGKQLDLVEILCRDDLRVGRPVKENLANSCVRMLLGSASRSRLLVSTRFGGMRISHICTYTRIRVRLRKYMAVHTHVIMSCWCLDSPFTKGSGAFVCAGEESPALPVGTDLGSMTMRLPAHQALLRSHPNRLSRDLQLAELCSPGHCNSKGAAKPARILLGRIYKVNKNGPAALLRAAFPKGRATRCPRERLLASATGLYAETNL